MIDMQPFESSLVVVVCDFKFPVLDGRLMDIMVLVGNRNVCSTIL